jgi:NTP pyrophosphatase (non-canonical NTP hydrolase)
MPDTFQQRALSTWHSNGFPAHLQRDHAILGLVGEAGELADLHKKDVFKPGHESSKQERIDELGDVLYYVAILAHLDGITLDAVSMYNAAKLSDGHGWKPDHTNRK